MIKKNVLIFLCILVMNNTYSQANDVEALFYNVSFSAIFGTVGAIINKGPKDEIRKVIIKGFSQGALGGAVTFESKYLLRESQTNNDWKLAWCAKILNAGGSSITENAALNRNFWESWHINIGFSRVEFNLNDDFEINYKLMPIAFGYTVGAFINYKFDFSNSLKFGEFLFSSKSLNSVNASTSAGYIVYNYNDYFNTNTTIEDKYKVVTHEIIHIYQSNDYMVLNTFFNKPLKVLAEKNHTLNFLNMEKTL